ncbi:TPA: CotH kinase family protein [Klebsiella pneumoniae]|nr:CotH kinase family protein [Klebsiella pneumoniae]
MAFNPELGSTSPAVLLDNAERLDKLVNGPAADVPDRGGDPLYSWRQMMAKNDEVRQNLIPLSKQYQTLAAAQADIANIPVGSTTYYRSPDDNALAVEVINNAGTLQPTGRKMPSQHGQKAIDLVQRTQIEKGRSIALVSPTEFTPYSVLKFNPGKGFYFPAVTAKGVVPTGVAGEEIDSETEALSDFIPVKKGITYELLSHVNSGPTTKVACVFYDKDKTLVGPIAMYSNVKPRRSELLHFITPEDGYIRVATQKSDYVKADPYLVKVGPERLRELSGLAGDKYATFYASAVSLQPMWLGAVCMESTSSPPLSLAVEPSDVEVVSRPIAVTAGQFLSLHLTPTNNNRVVRLCYLNDDNTIGSVVSSFNPNVEWDANYSQDKMVDWFNIPIPTTGKVVVVTGVGGFNRSMYSLTADKLPVGPVAFTGGVSTSIVNEITRSPVEFLINSAGEYPRFRQSPYARPSRVVLLRLKAGDIFHYNFTQQANGANTVIGGLWYKSFVAVNLDGSNPTTLAGLGADSDNASVVNDYAYNTRGHFRDIEQDRIILISYQLPPGGGSGDVFEVVSLDTFRQQRDTYAAEGRVSNGSYPVEPAYSWVLGANRAGLEPVLVLKGEVVKLTHPAYAGFLFKRPTSGSWLSTTRRGVSAKYGWLLQEAPWNIYNPPDFISRALSGGSYYDNGLVDQKPDTNMMTFTFTASEDIYLQMSTATQYEYGTDATQVTVNMVDASLMRIKAWSEEAYRKGAAEGTIKVQRWGVNMGIRPTSAELTQMGWNLNTGNNIGSEPVFLKKGMSVEMANRLYANIANSYGYYPLIVPVATGKAAYLFSPKQSDIMSQQPTHWIYTATEDCWVICNGRVYLESEFSGSDQFSVQVRNQGMPYVLKYVSPGYASEKLTISDLREFSLPKFEGTLRINMYNGFIPGGVKADPSDSAIIEFVVGRSVVGRFAVSTGIQGNSSATDAKKNIDLKFVNSKGKKVNISIAGWIPANNLVLKNNFTDRSCVRDLVCPAIWRQMRRVGTYPKNQLFDIQNADSTLPEVRNVGGVLCSTDGVNASLYINDIFIGLYTLRIKKKVENYAMNEDLPLNIMLESGDNGFTWGKSSWKTIVIDSPAGFDEAVEPGDSETKVAIKRFMDWSDSVMAGTTSLRESYADYINLQGWLDYIIAIEALDHSDSMVKNQIWCTWDGKVWDAMIYDTDRSLGITGSNKYLLSQKQGIYALFWRDMLPELKARYKTLRDSGVVSVDNISAEIIRCTGNLDSDALEKDLLYWAGRFPGDIGKSKVSVMLKFVADKITYLDGVLGYS